MRTVPAILLAISAACSTNMIRVKEEGRGGPDTFRAAIIYLKSYNGPRNSQAEADAVIDRNFARTAPLVRMAARSGAKVIVTPEYINSGVLFPRRARPFISTRVPPAPTDQPVWQLPDREIAKHLRDYSRLAVEVDAYLVTDVVERAEKKGKTVYYNSMVAFDPEGRLIAKYRKINLYFFERFLETAGHTPVSFDTPYGRFGMLLCLDTLAPWTWGKLTREHKVDFLVTQTLWEHTPFVGSLAMNLLAALSGRDVLWSNQRRLPLGGGAGIIRPFRSDTSLGIWGSPGVVVANLEIPERLRVTAAKLPRQ